MVTYISITEFREFGFLQELNRQFLHPLGLALEVTIDGDGSEHLSGIWDYRSDPEGMRYADGTISAAKAARVQALADRKRVERQQLLKYVVQPVPDEPVQSDDTADSD